jgi:hypothetical protein
MWGRAGALRIVLASALSGCSSLQGLSGGDSPIPDAATPEAGSDAAPEAGADAAADAGADVDAGPFCQAQGRHTFCADFDEVGVDSAWADGGPAPWTRVQADGVVKQDPSVFVSAPMSLRTLLPANLAGFARLRTVLPLPTTTMRFAFRLRVDGAPQPVDGGGPASTQLFSFGFPGYVVQLALVGASSLVVEESTVCLDAGCGKGNGTMLGSPLPLLGAWADVAMNATFSTPTSGTLAVSLNGAQIGTLALGPPSAFQPNVFCTAGLNAPGSSAADIEAHYDNFLADVQ